MNVSVIVPYPGKQKYQTEYDAIVRAVERAGDTVLSPEKSKAYQQTLARDTKIRDTPRAHYEFVRKNIIDSDAVIVEASWEDFRVGHETTLALIYRKPVLALSQSLELGKYIHHPDFYGVKYAPKELAQLVVTFLKKVKEQQQTTRRLPATVRANSKSIAVFGGVYADIFNQVAQIPRENEVALSKDFKISLGGKATNAAVALARLGDEVFMCGQVGHDTMGNDLEAVLVHEGIKTNFLHQDKGSTTGTVTLAANRRAQYSTVVHEAANVRITKESVDEVFSNVDAGKLQLDCVYLTLEPQPEIVAYIIHEAFKRQLFTFCDAAPHTRPLDLGLLKFIDVVAPNQLEAQAMTGMRVSDQGDAQRVGGLLMKHGAQRVVITLGDKGAFYLGDHISQHIPALKVNAIDEAGAGDAFRAVLVHELLRSHSMAIALKRATIAGAYAVTHFGSYDSMPDNEQLEAFAKGHKLRQNVIT